MLARYYAVVGLPVHLSVTSRCYIETTRRNQADFWYGGFLPPMPHCVTRRSAYLQKLAYTFLSDLRIKRLRVRISVVPLSGDNLGQVVHTCVPVTKQYNSVPVKGRCCPAAGKVAAGPASHWPSAADFSGSSTYGFTA